MVGRIVDLQAKAFHVSFMTLVLEWRMKQKCLHEQLLPTAMHLGEHLERPYPRAFFICSILELFYLFSRIPLSLRVSYKAELFAA